MTKFSVLLSLLGAMLWMQGMHCAQAASMRMENVTVETSRGPHVFHMELAVTKAEQAKGLMHRKALAADAGMLFDFGQPVMCGFWMKDTPLPLDMLFVRPDGRISTIAANAVPNSTTEIKSVESVRAVIEINGGRAQALGIAPGDIVHAHAFGNALGKAERAH